MPTKRYCYIPWWVGSKSRRAFWNERVHPKKNEFRPMGCVWNRWRVAALEGRR